MMEVMQCGQNWNMMIQKREIFRNYFDDFDYQSIAYFFFRYNLTKRQIYSTIRTDYI